MLQLCQVHSISCFNWSFFAEKMKSQSHDCTFTFVCCSFTMTKLSIGLPSVRIFFCRHLVLPFQYHSLLLAVPVPSFCSLTYFTCFSLSIFSAIIVCFVILYVVTSLVQVEPSFELSRWNKCCYLDNVCCIICCGIFGTQL